ncbi:hypothetical protein [Streptomyces sp. NPDC047803]
MAETPPEPAPGTEMPLPRDRPDQQARTEDDPMWPLHASSHS